MAPWGKDIHLSDQLRAWDKGVLELGADGLKVEGGMGGSVVMIIKDPRWDDIAAHASTLANVDEFLRVFSARVQQIVAVELKNKS